jgi:hypothetical protein
MRERTSLDLVASNLPAMADELDSGRVTYTLQVVRAWYVVDASPYLEDKERLLEDFEDAVFEDQLRLMQARRNVEEALALEPKMLEAIEAAVELRAMAKSTAGFYLMFYSGITIEEIWKIQSNLAWFAASHRAALKALKRLHSRLDHAIEANDRIFEQIEAKRGRIREPFTIEERRGREEEPLIKGPPPLR